MLKTSGEIMPPLRLGGGGKVDASPDYNMGGTEFRMQPQGQRH